MRTYGLRWPTGKPAVLFGSYSTHELFVVAYAWAVLRGHAPLPSDNRKPARAIRCAIDHIFEDVILGVRQ